MCISCIAGRKGSISSHKALIPQSSRTSKVQTVDKSTELAATQPIATALFERLHAVVDNDANELLRLSVTLQLFEIRSGSERSGPGCAVTARVRGLDQGAVGEQAGAVVETNRGEDGGHVIVVREVGVQLATEREGRVAGVEGAVSRGVVVYRLACQAGDELVGEAYALGWSERVAMRIAVVLVEGLSSLVGLHDNICRVY